MSNYTTTILDYVRTELQKKNYNEFYRGNQFTGESFLTSLYVNNTEIVELSKDAVFGFFKFSSADCDDWFKRAFLYSFYDAEIKFQTIDLFRLRLLSYLFKKQKYIEHIFENFEDIISGRDKTEKWYKDNDKGDNTFDASNRSAESDLPDNRINLDVENNVLEYANNNLVSINKDKRHSETAKDGWELTETTKINMEDILSCSSLFDELFEEMDRLFFLQIF